MAPVMLQTEGRYTSGTFDTTLAIQSELGRAISLRVLGPSLCLGKDLQSLR